MKITILRIISGLGALALLVPSAHAQDTPGDQLDEIVVFGRFLEDTIPLEISRYGSRVEIISGDQLRDLGVNDIAESLQMLVPGVFIAPKNGPFDYFVGSLQGSRSEDILWLIDGVRINNRLYNGTTPLDTVPAHMVERVEVLMGGQGIFYGTQSVSGVINVVTKAFSSEREGSVGAAVHTNDGYNVNFSFRDNAGDSEFVLFGSNDDADGYQPFKDSDIQPSTTDRNRSYEVLTLGAKYAYNFSDLSRLSLSYQFTDNQVDWAFPAQYRTRYNARDEDIAILKWDFSPSDRVSALVKAYYHNWDSHFTRIDNDPANPAQTRVVSDAEYWGYEDYGLNALVRLDTDHGLQYVIGYDRQSYSGSDQVLLIADQKETVNAAFAQLRSEDLFENTQFAVGARFNSRSDADDTTVWNATGKHYFGGSTTYIRGNVGTSFRLPDAWQLFGNDPCCTQGNPALEPEESFNIEVGIGGENAGVRGTLNWELTSFRRVVDNLIASRGGMRINSDAEVEISGAELSVSVGLNDNWSISGDITSTDAEGNDGRQIPNIPELTTKLHLQYTAANQPFSGSIAISNVGDIFSDVGGFFATGEHVEHGNYTVVNASGSYRFGEDDRITLGVRIENLFDDEYATRVSRATSDTGTVYLYDNLGVPLTGHISLRYDF